MTTTMIPKVLLEEASKVQTPIQVFETWHVMAKDAFSKNGYPVLKDFYDGYATGLEDVLRYLKAQPVEPVKEVVETVAKQTHHVRTAVIIGGVVVGFVLYKRYKNGVLFPNQQKET